MLQEVHIRRLTIPQLAERYLDGTIGIMKKEDLQKLLEREERISKIEKKGESFTIVSGEYAITFRQCTKEERQRFYIKNEKESYYIVGKVECWEGTGKVNTLFQSDLMEILMY